MLAPDNKILLVGSLFQNSEGHQQLKAFQKLGYDVIALSDTEFDHAPGVNYHPTLMERVRHRLQIPKDHTDLNSRLHRYVEYHQPQIVWVVKSLVLKPKLLKQLKQKNPSVQLIWYSGDDMVARHNQSRYFRQGLPFYDMVYTTKRYNCQPDELPALGAKRVVFIEKAFDPDIHYPIDVNDEDRSALGADVGFIGTYEKDRAEKMFYLAQHGITVRVWGNDWQKCPYKHPNLQIEYRPLYGLDFQKSICGTKINLCFLRKLNRDRHTNRSIEIPAFGSFMLAERTDEHQNLFKEGEEAAFFDTDDHEELLEKVQYYLKHDEKRQQIAAKGRQRCLDADYSMTHRVQTMLEYL